MTKATSCTSTQHHETVLDKLVELRDNSVAKSIKDQKGECLSPSSTHPQGGGQATEKPQQYLL